MILIHNVIFQISRKKNLILAAAVLAVLLAALYLIVISPLISPVSILDASDAGGFLRPLGVATDDTGNIFVVDSGNHRLLAFNGRGRLIFNVGKQGGGNGEFNYPTAVSITSDGYIIVCDLHNLRLQVLDNKGNFLHSITGSAEEPIRPTAIAVDNNNLIYVADVAAQQIIVFTVDGQEVKRFGEPGSDPGQFNFVNGLALDKENELLYVADSNNNRIQAFYLDGTLAFMLSENLGLPRGLAYDHNSNLLYVADALAHRVAVFDANRTLVATLGIFGTEKDAFSFPNSVALDESGRIFVADRENDRIVIWRQLPKQPEEDK